LIETLRSGGLPTIAVLRHQTPDLAHLISLIINLLSLFVPYCAIMRHMPNDPNAPELDKLERAIATHADGVGMVTLLQEFPDISRRTLNRRLHTLIATQRVQRLGDGRGVIYIHGSRDQLSTQHQTSPAAFTTPDGSVEIKLSKVSRNVLDYVSRPANARTPAGYEYRFLDEYQPNRTSYLPDSVKAHLHKIGRPIDTARAAGTFARDILARLLIDLSWSSSRLEGNTYSRLDTQRLIEFGQAADGKDAKETQMILNHKAAIEMLVDNHDDVGVNRFTILNLHALLSEELMADPEASGRLRRRPVEIGKSTFVPLAVPQLLEERFNLTIKKAAAIKDPFEQAFFLMAHLPYLQPFEDVNKRVSRLAANIPLFQQNLCPLSFVDVPEQAYILGTLGIYEMTRVELLRDVFIWAYERSCQKYVVVHDSIVEPDIFKMKYRAALTEVIAAIIRAGIQPTSMEISRRARELVSSEVEQKKFVALVQSEFGRLYEGNIARYRVRLSEFEAWRKKIVKPKPLKRT
jgi:hypothetical protein